MTNPNKPTPADIAHAIELAEQGDWIDPSEVPINWLCELYDPEGKCVGNGNGRTASEAMGLAWLHVHAPDPGRLALRAHAAVAKQARLRPSRLSKSRGANAPNERNRLLDRA